MAERSSPYLIPDYPVIVLTRLASLIGLNEAVFIQQAHYLLTKLEGKVEGDTHWIKMTMRDWEHQFPFWSRNTIRRIIDHLMTIQKVLKRTDDLNADPLDRSFWYTIDYDLLDNLPGKPAKKKRADYDNFGEWVKTRKQQNNADDPKVGKSSDDPNLGHTEEPSQAADKPANFRLSKVETMQDPKFGRDSETSFSETSSGSENTILQAAANASLAEDLDASLTQDTHYQEAKANAATTRLQTPNATPVEVPASKQGMESPKESCAKESTPPALPDGYQWRSQPMTDGYPDTTIRAKTVIVRHIAKLHKKANHKALCGAYACQVNAGYRWDMRAKDCPDCQRVLAERTAPKAKAPPKPHPRDPVYDTLATVYFRIPNLERLPAKTQRWIGVNASEVKACQPEGMTTEQLVDDLKALPAWYAQHCPGLSLPQVGVKICGYLSDMRADRVRETKPANGKPVHDPNCPRCHGLGVIDVGNNTVELCQGVCHAA